MLNKIEQQQQHKIPNRMAGNLLRRLLIFFGLALYIMGRVCDDMNWYPYPGITPDNLEIIAISGLVASSVLIAIVQIMKQEEWRVIFFESQKKFVIPWALVILECVLVFDTFGCHSDDTPRQGQDMDYRGCSLYVVTLLFTNLCYSLCCSQRTDYVYLIVFEITHFAEVIYNGILLLTFINNMQGKPKDYSILFISIMIAWLVLVMDLMFRGIYEDKNKEERHEKLKELVRVHHETCEKHDLGLQVKYQEHKN